jgi:hypothetical protein
MVDTISYYDVYVSYHDISRRPAALVPSGFIKETAT